MSNCIQTLTATQMKYFIFIGQQQEETAGIRCSQIAQRFGVTKASVHVMVSVLQDKKLVTKEKYGSVFLTEVGRRMMTQYSKYSRRLFGKLQSTLPLSERACSDAVCVLLTELSEEELSAICADTK